MKGDSVIRLRRATDDDVPTLERWDTDPDVIAATTDDDDVELAFGGLDWHAGVEPVVRCQLLPDRGTRRSPIGAMQIIDPHEEPSHYWGEIEPNLRAVDIWIGAPEDRGKGIRCRDDASRARPLFRRPARHRHCN
jgi:aminoglycoside 6'-N-acetyltransferase